MAVHGGITSVICRKALRWLLLIDNRLAVRRRLRGKGSGTAIEGGHGRAWLRMRRLHRVGREGNRVLVVGGWRRLYSRRHLLEMGAVTMRR